jgi:hypothetical protein
LLLPTERNKTLTGLANTEPYVGAQHPRAQGMQWFLSEASRAAKGTSSSVACACCWKSRAQPPTDKECS